MNINLDNYEEFFLLYADNELSPEKRREVEQFINENPEFEEEFDMIRMTIVEPDETFRLLDKSFLLKSDGTVFIHEQNYEEIFLLFHDGELTEEQKGKTNDFLEKHAELKEEFLLIGQAKIQADPVSFPDKKSLLRKEHSGMSGRIILFRSLAAALVLGFGFWLAIPYFNGDTIQPQVAGQTNPPDTNINIQNSSEKSSGQPGKEEIAVIEKKVQAAEGLPEEENPGTENSEQKPAGVFHKNEKQILAKNEAKQSNVLQPEKKIESDKENKKREEVTDGLIAQIPLKKISIGDFIHSNEIAHVDLDITLQAIEKNNSTQNAVYLDVDKESSDNYIFYNVPANEFKKSKVGGFLKKLKRIAERNDPIKRLFELEGGQVASNN